MSVEVDGVEVAWQWWIGESVEMKPFHKGGRKSSGASRNTSLSDVHTHTHTQTSHFGGGRGLIEVKRLSEGEHVLQVSVGGCEYSGESEGGEEVKYEGGGGSGRKRGEKLAYTESVFIVARPAPLGYATHCNTLQQAATRCNSLQHTAIHCNTRVQKLFSSWQDPRS